MNTIEETNIITDPTAKKSSYMKEYYKNNKEKRKAASKEWQKNNAEKDKENQKKWQANNQERLKAYRRQYHAKKYKPAKPVESFADLFNSSSKDSGKEKRQKTIEATQPHRQRNYVMKEKPLGYGENLKFQKAIKEIDIEKFMNMLDR